MKNVVLLSVAGSLFGLSLVACDQSTSKTSLPPARTITTYVAPAGPTTLARKPDTAEEVAGKARAMLAQVADYMGTSKWREADAMLRNLETIQAGLPPDLGDQVTRDRAQINQELEAMGTGTRQGN